LGEDHTSLLTRRASPSRPNPHQRPHLQTPSHWGSGFTFESEDSNPYHIEIVSFFETPPHYCSMTPDWAGSPQTTLRDSLARWLRLFSRQETGREQKDLISVSYSY
jgi:hypothetical protein